MPRMARRGSSSSGNGSRGGTPRSGKRVTSAKPARNDDKPAAADPKAGHPSVAVMERPAQVPEVSGPGPDAPASDSTSMKFPAEADLGEPPVEVEAEAQEPSQRATQQAVESATEPDPAEPDAPPA